MRNFSAHWDPEQVTEDEASRGVDEPNAGEFSPREGAALALAERMALDHHSFSDDTMRDLRARLNEAKPLLERRAAIDIKGLAGYMWRAHKIESHFRHVLFALRLTLGHEVIDGTCVGFFGRFARRRECVV